MCDINLDDICLPDEPFGSEQDHLGSGSGDSVGNSEAAIGSDASRVDDLPVPKLNQEKPHSHEPIKVKLNVRSALKPFSLGSSKTFVSKDIDDVALPQLKNVGKTPSKLASKGAKPTDNKRLLVASPNATPVVKAPIDKLMEKAKKSLIYSKTGTRSSGDPIEEYNPAEPLDDKDSESSKSRRSISLLSPTQCTDNEVAMQSASATNISESLVTVSEANQSVEMKIDAEKAPLPTELCDEKKIDTADDSLLSNPTLGDKNVDSAEQLTTATEPLLKFSPNKRYLESYVNIKCSSKTKITHGENSPKRQKSIDDRDSAKAISSRRSDADKHRSELNSRRRSSPRRNRERRSSDRDRYASRHGKSSTGRKDDRGHRRDRRSDHRDPDQAHGSKRDDRRRSPRRSDRHSSSDRKHKSSKEKIDSSSKNAEEIVKASDTPVNREIVSDCASVRQDEMGAEPISVELSVDCEEVNDKKCSELIDDQKDSSVPNDQFSAHCAERVSKNTDFECEISASEKCTDNNKIEPDAHSQQNDCSTADSGNGCTVNIQHQLDPMVMVEHLVMLTDDKEVLGVLALLKLLLRKKMNEGVFYKNKNESESAAATRACANSNTTVPRGRDISVTAKIKSASDSAVAEDQRRPDKKVRRRRTSASPPPPPPKKDRGGDALKSSTKSPTVIVTPTTNVAVIPPPPPRSAPPIDQQVRMSQQQSVVQNSVVAPTQFAYVQQAQQAVLVPVATYRPLFNSNLVQCHAGGFNQAMLPPPHQTLAGSPYPQPPILYEQPPQQHPNIQLLNSQPVTAHDFRPRSIKRII